MTVAAHTGIWYAKSTSSSVVSGDELDGINDSSVSREITELETTDFKDAGYKTRIAGLKDGTIKLSGDYEVADAPQGVIRTAFEAGNTLYLTNLRDGTNGFRYPVLCTSIEESAGVDGKVQCTFNFKLNGAPTAIP